MLVVLPVRSPGGAVRDATIIEANAAAGALARRGEGALHGLLVSEVFPGAWRRLVSWLGDVDGVPGIVRSDHLPVPGGEVRHLRCQVSALGDQRVAILLSDHPAPEVSAGGVSRMRDVAPTELLVLEGVRDAAGEVCDLRITDISAAAAERLGVDPHAALGTDLSRYVSSARLERTLARYRRVQAEGRAVEVEDQEDGRWLVSQLTPLGDALAVVVRDETPRQRAADEAHRLAEMFGFVSSAAAEMIALHGPDGRFLFASEASRELVGIAPEDLVGMHPAHLLDPVDGRLAARLMAAAARGRLRPAPLTVRVTRPDGEVRTLDVTVRPLPDGAIAGGLVSLSRDAGPRLSVQQRVEARADEQRALRHAATTAARLRGSLSGVADAIVAQLAGLVDAGAVVLVRQDGAEGHGLVAAAAGPSVAVAADDPCPSRIHPAPGGGRGIPVECPGLAHTGGGALGVGITVDGRHWGMLVVVARAGCTLPPDAPGIIARFGEIAAVAVGAVRERARLASQALRDPLTGLSNHRCLHERLRSEVSRAARHARPLTIALFDVDHLKEVNTAHGYLGGDAALAEVARRLAAATRDGELLARTGGEQFAWILVETSAEQAVAAVERARRAVAEKPVFADAHVTLSAGLCDLGWAGDAEHLFRLAEGALYWAKSTGRDRAVVYEPGTVGALSAEERAERLERSQALVALRSLARAVDAKDPSTHSHSERVSTLCERVALRLGWPVERAALLAEAALLHDVGKIGVPDAVLLNPGRLSPEEFEVVKRHAALGAQIADEALTAEQCSWIRGHHERWDGAGYPDALRGTEIPEGARIIAAADAWDVMTRARHYGSIRDQDDALRELTATSGSQFWPDVVEVFVAMVRED